MSNDKSVLDHDEAAGKVIAVDSASRRSGSGSFRLNLARSFLIGPIVLLLGPRLWAIIKARSHLCPVVTCVSALESITGNKTPLEHLEVREMVVENSSGSGGEN